MENKPGQVVRKLVLRRHGYSVWNENTTVFVQFALGLGQRSILHKDIVSTSAEWASLGFQSDAGVLHETG